MGASGYFDFSRCSIAFITSTLRPTENTTATTRGIRSRRNAPTSGGHFPDDAQCDAQFQMPVLARDKLRTIEEHRDGKAEEEWLPQFNTNRPEAADCDVP